MASEIAISSAWRASVYGAKPIVLDFSSPGMCGAYIPIPVRPFLQNLSIKIVLSSSYGILAIVVVLSLAVTTDMLCYGGLMNIIVFLIALSLIYWSSWAIILSGDLCVLALKSLLISLQL